MNDMGNKFYKKFLRIRVFKPFLFIDGPKGLEF